MPPSALHEILVALFREQPALATTLLGPILGDQVPPGALRVLEAAFTQIAPTEFTADLVIAVGEPPQLGIILEVQLGRDEPKRFSWPLYACALRARWRCPVVVLVLAPDPGVAGWAAAPIVIGPNESRFCPLVVGPAAIPRVTSPEVARNTPELAVLSALAHGDESEGEAVLLAMLAGLSGLHDDTAKLYYDLVMSRLTDASRQALEDAMNTGGYEYQSEFARRFMAEGRVEGMAQEACRLVLRLLVRRFGLLGQELQTRIETLELAHLESLADALLDFGSLADLQAWLDAQ